METNHHDHHHVHTVTSLNGIYIIAIVLNLSFVAVEAAVGFLSDSVGLLSDAGHNLSDVFSLLLAMLAFRLSRSHATGKFTYGFRKTSVLISLLNAVILLAAVGAIILESIRKFREPVPVDGAAMTWTAAAGILVNGITTIMLMKQQKHDINTRGAFLHMAADTLVSVGVVISGIIISVTGFTAVDPLIGLVVAAVILVSSWKLLAESLRMSIDAVPENINPEEIVSMMSGEPGVAGVHHVHIWAISTVEVALTAHVVISEPSRMEEIKSSLKQRLSSAGISHSTLEIEFAGSQCPDMERSGPLGCARDDRGALKKTDGHSL